MKGFKNKKKQFIPTGNKKTRSPSMHDRKKRFENAKIQSLIFNKKKFSMSQAKEWTVDHGYKAVKVEPTKNTWRIRQFSPNKIKRGTECKTIQFGGSGVQGVLCNTPDKFKRDRYAKEGLSTQLGAIISPPKKAPKILISQLTDDLDFRDKLIDTNKEIKEEIKTDPQGEFSKGSREEFKENAKEIKNLSKDAKRAFNDLPKEEKESLDRELLNRLRVLR